MGGSTPIKGRCLKNINSQKRRMPDVILHTKNVMIPVMKSIPFKQSCDISFSKNKRQIRRTQNCKGSPALLFSEAPLYKLHNPLEIEVKRNSPWKVENQSTKYTIFEKNNSANIEKISTSQNSHTLKKLSLNEKNNGIHFPNTVLMQSELVKDNRDLHKVSSKSIKLLRKCNLSQMKENQTKHENISPPLPKRETPVSNIINKSIVSPSHSFYDIVSTVSTSSTSSLSSFKIENVKTFVNIVNRETSRSSITSNHLHPNNSEYEINVLHYENDITSGNNFSQFAQSHLKSINTDWVSTYNCNSAPNRDNNFVTQKNSSFTRDRDKTESNVKYSWEIDNWVPPSQRKGLDNECEIKIAEKNGKNPYRCKIKYSWQVIGMGTQTSYTLLQNLLNNLEDNKSAYKMRVKYSWQVIGTSTQASLSDYNDPDYWNGILLTPSKNYNRNEAEISNNKGNHARLPEGRLKKYLILSNQSTQTFVDKEIQVDPNMEQILEGLTKQKLIDKLELEQINNYDELLQKYINIKSLTPNISSKKSVISDNEKTKREELLMQLIYALKKLNQYEQSVDKNRGTDILYPNREDTLVQKGETLQNVEGDIKSIIESTQEYIGKLNCQLKDLDNADQQIENSMMRTLKDIDETFQSVLDDVCYEINQRRGQLILEAEIHKQESLIPLRACRKEVEAQIKNAQNIISMSENVLQHPQQHSANKLGKIISASNDIGRIPAVPYSEELPNINFNCPLNLCKEEIMEQISKLGYISCIEPVQIMNIEERPAGLFVKWHVTNPEYFTEEQTFVVEKANGEILDLASSKFKTVYIGPETSCFIRNIPVDRPITLRIRIQTDNGVAKSIHHIVKTSIPSYNWELDNKNYAITNNKKTAEKITDTISTLFSQGPQFDANHIVEFKFLEVSQEGRNDEGIALVYDPQGSHDTLKRAAALMITPQGKIFMDGEEKLMRLPKMYVGVVIMISAFRKSAHVLRVNIESENKCVTYDWRVQTPLYLAARFTEPKKWVLMIE